MAVLEELKVKNVIISKQGEDSQNLQEFKKITNKKKIPTIIVGSDVLDSTKKQSNSNIKMKDTVKIQIEKDIYFNFLWPKNPKMINENVLNNNSIVCKLNYKGFSCLFTGDIEQIAEKEILEQYKNDLQILNSTVLKVAHHGSKTSSTEGFLEAVKPKISLIGVGLNNTFGHPNDNVLKRLESTGSKVYRTDKMGEVSITVNKNEKMKIKKFIENSD